VRACIRVYAHADFFGTWCEPRCGTDTWRAGRIDGLMRGIYVDYICVQSPIVYMYAGLRVLMIWANCSFSFNKSNLLRRVEDVTTISKLQFLTAIRIKDCTLGVPNKPSVLFLYEKQSSFIWNSFVQGKILDRQDSVYSLNCVSRRSKVSAIYVTAKTICKCLVLVPGWRSVDKFTSKPLAKTHLPLFIATISGFACLFVRGGPEHLEKEINEILG